jgi:uncharacterized protein YrrD
MSHAEYAGSKLVDEQGSAIGEVSDVIYDETETNPQWLVVKQGLFRSEHYVPADGAYRTDDDHIVVPFTAENVKSAPKAKGDHVLTHELRDELVRHYDLAR